VSILVTDDTGFIGSNSVLDWLNPSDEPVLSNKDTQGATLKTAEAFA
jgi:nucleoside-diphosphate-sugar epimerase